jgi:hypothetical protein
MGLNINVLVQALQLPFLQYDFIMRSTRIKTIIVCHILSNIESFCGVSAIIF